MQSPQRRRYDSGRAVLAGGGGGGRGDLSPFRGGKGRDARNHLRDECQHKPSYHRHHSPSPPVMHERRLRVTPPMVDRGEGYVYTTSRGLDARNQQIQMQVHPYYSLSHGSLHHPASGHDPVHQPAPGYADEDVAQVGYLGSQDKYLIRNHPADEHVGLARPVRIRDMHPVSEGPVLAPSSMDAGGEKIFVRGSGFMDGIDIPARGFWTLRPEPGSSQHTGPNGFIVGNTGATAARSTSRYEIYKDDDLFHPNHPNHVRDMYMGVDNEQARYKDVLYEAPPVQPRDFGVASYLGLPKDNIPVAYQETPHMDRNATHNVMDYRDQPMLRDDYSQIQDFNPVNQQRPSPLIRKGTEDGIYSDIVWRDRVINIHNQIRRHPQEDCSYMEEFHSSYNDPLTYASPDATTKLKYWDHHASFQEDPEYDFYDKERALEETVYEDEPSAFKSRVNHGHESSYIRDEYGYELVDEMEAYKERSRSSMPPEQSGKVGYESHYIQRRRNKIEKVDIYDLQSDRLSRRRYLMDDEVDGGDPRNFTRTVGNAMRRVGKPNRNSEQWRGKSRGNVAFQKRYGTGHLQSLLSHKASGSDARFTRRGPLGIYKDGLNSSLKRRLTVEPSAFENSYHLSRKQDLSKPYKLQRKDPGATDESKTPTDKDSVESSKHVKTDPPEGSEEFKHLTHKAFLRFSKILNENPHQREKYKEQGKAGSLICFACGSLSKEFVDTHSLVMHTFNSRKIGLRTDHLGLHKALCVLMGWNCSVPPDGAKIYQSGPVSEALRLKYDLIVWPPVVVIHNTSVGNNNMKGGPKVVTKEDMEEILGGIGFGKGKFTGLCQGKLENNSILLVKFYPTFSGLQEAEKLHNHYADQKRGRKELQDARHCKGGDKARDVSKLEAEELLYGYMATVEDLNVLDSETKRRCVIKSKKDIEAIADAPLMAD